ncbi:MAG: stage II sporulation protein D [Ignavibacteriales bacterium]
MFYRYEIKNVEEEQILYLFVDDKYEFAVLNNRNETSLHDKIKKYIKDMKISFNGTKVALVVGGILVMVLLSTSPNTSTNGMFNNNKLSSQIIGEEVVDKDETNVEEIPTVSEEKGNEVITEEPIKEEVTVKEQPKTIAPPTVSAPKKEEPVVQAPTVQAPVVQEPVVQAPTVQAPVVQEPVVQEPTAPAGTMVTVVRSSGIISQIELEEYLIGVVGGEMPASFNIEALKAQAVVARTYTLKRISQGKTLTDTEATQVYKDNTQLQAMWGGSYSTYYNKIKSAVDSTKGQYITYYGNYIDAVYHSTSNGYTEDAVYVWGYNIPYLKSVDSHWDLNASTYLRTVQKTDAEILNVMGINITSDSVIEVLERSSSNRINKIEIDGNIYSGLDLYKKLGLRSRDFDFEVINGVLNITTRGYGHGVGMSQYGANGMANSGYSYQDIINHYYTNVQIASK